MRRLLICGLAAAMAAILGPRIVGPRSHSAGSPFVYEPPEGFVPATDAKATEAGAKVWVHEAGDRKASARIVLHHASKEMSVEETDLAKLASEMPKAFEGACTWVHRRHEMRLRADGARVGLIEGDCDRAVDLSALGLGAQALKARKLQLMFPDDTGTWIVTASYPTEDASRWEPLFEATISSAKGVATRAPAPAGWTYAASAAAGAVLAWLATAIASRKDGDPAPAKAPARGVRRRAREAEEREEEEQKEEEREDA